MKDYYLGDDDFSFSTKYDFGQSAKDHRNNALSVEPRISYRYIDLDSTSYHFYQDCFDNKDIRNYFRMLKLISQSTLDELIHSDYKLHFRLNLASKKELELLKFATGFKGSFNPNNTPDIGHFALYTNDVTEGADKIKSPRIFFFLGPMAVFYILFYDPYHEIHSKVSS